MGIWNSTTLYDNNFDLTTATTEGVYFGFIVKMPFRFRVSSPYHCHFEHQGHEYDLWIRNKPMEMTEPVIEPLIRQGGKVEDLWSTIAVIPNKSHITADELTSVQNCQGK